MLLDSINSPADLKKIPENELGELAKEIRQVLITKLAAHGGHVGPNLGTVELEIAMHYVFNSPVDRLVFDVSHQSYTHKIITGRREAFTDPSKYDEDSGFTNPEESEHDWFNIGHTSTSISLASGLAKARDLAGDHYNVVTVIGDGSLSGGEAFEGFDVVGEMGTNFITIVNDNGMSIAENHGGLYKNLKALREGNGVASTNYFTAMGFDYRFLKDGNNVEELIAALRELKDIDHPVVLHICTEKGLGYEPAETHKEIWHWHNPFDIATGKTVHAAAGKLDEVQAATAAANNASAAADELASYEELSAQWLMDKIEHDPRFVVITSGTPMVVNFTKERRDKAGKQFVDVGIAEETAVAMASGLAKNGAIPVYAFSGTFVQRAYDQIMQDLCINDNPAVLLDFSSSVYGMNDVTHLSLCDIAMMGNIPNLVYLAPTCAEEYVAMLEWATTQRDHPVAIRVPATGMVVTGVKDTTDYSKLNTFSMTHRGSGVAIVGIGDFFPFAESLAKRLNEELGIDATLINPKFITGLDTAMLADLERDHTLVLTLEDGQLQGGFGEKIASFYGPTAMRVKNYGIQKSFPDRYVPAQLLAQNGVTLADMTDDVRKLIAE